MPRRPSRSAHALRAAGGVGAALGLAGCAALGPAAVDPALPAPTADGAYHGTGRYETPGGPQRLDVTVVLEEGVVEDVRVDPAATNTTSRHFQERFASAVVEEVVGRPLAEVDLDRVAGSSSTGAGFRDALAQMAHRGARD